jgi:type III secretory pathway component EscV
VKLVKRKTVAFVLLLVIMAGSIIATAVSTTPISFSQITNFFSVLGVGNTAVALADPVGGGPGGGGHR